MRRHGIRARGKRRFRVSTIDSNHALPIAPKLLARNCTVGRANTAWAGDMTYLPTGAKAGCTWPWCLDPFSRRIVVGSLGTTMGTTLGTTITAELAPKAAPESSGRYQMRAAEFFLVMATVHLGLVCIQRFIGTIAGIRSE